MIDLHIHTTFSDGSDTPLEIVNKAKELNLSQIAITDHNCLDGAIIARENTNDLDVIIGVELSCLYHNREVHLLGYFINNNGFINVGEFIKKGLIEKKKAQREMINKLNNIGIDISYQEVLDAFPNTMINRVHICRVLMNKGYINSINEGFNLYLGNDCPCFVQQKCGSIEDAINAIHLDGGIAVLAHSYKYSDDAPTFINDILKSLDGIEVYHTSHSEKQSKILKNIAINNNKIITGGSDYHGINKPNIKLGGIKDKYKISRDYFN